MSQKVLVTGASSGFGTLICNTLLDKGYTVVGSLRDADGRNKEAAEALKAKGASVVELDVTDENSVNKGVAAAIEAAGGLDVVINNAGVGVLGLQEAFTVEDWQRVFDVNVFGVQRVNRAALPTLRKQGSGTLIQISSLLGRFVLPFFGPYNATKHAVEALADNYRVELSGFGVESLIVEPGGYGTDFGAKLIKASDSDTTASYGEMAGAPDAMMEGFGDNFEGENAPDPQDVADAVAKLLDTPRGQRPFRTVVDGMGMGEPIEAINNAADQSTEGIYNAFEIGGMLKVKA